VVDEPRALVVALQFRSAEMTWLISTRKLRVENTIRQQQNNNMSSPAIDLQMLPDDVGALKQMVVDLAAQLESLKQQFLVLRRAHFGASSEQFAGQAELFAERLSLPVPPVQTETVTYERARRGRPALPKDLPRLRVEYDLTSEEKASFDALERIGEETSETLDYIPARLQVIEHVRAKYAARRKGEEERTVLTAPMPPAPLPKSNASPKLLSHVLVSKYADHLPLNRIEGIFRRQGVELARSTLCDWVLGSTELLAVLYEALKAHMLAAPKIHADDTLLPLQDRERNRTVQARLWAYLGAGARLDEHGQWIAHPAAAYYEFTDDRRAERVSGVLGGYSGYLQADAYAGFNALYASGKILEVGCWAHARRKFFEIAEAAPKDTRIAAHEALDWIGQLYALESEIREEPPDKKRQIREEKALPVLTDLRAWLEAALRAVLPRSPTAGAIGYALSNWGALTRYVESGILDIDNNACERAIRPIALGRKNWLFAGSDRGGRAAAIAFSLIQTCKLHGVEPFAYLADVLRRLPSHPINRVAELLPFRWQPAS
jgi:transposase